MIKFLRNIRLNNLPQIKRNLAIYSLPYILILLIFELPLVFIYYSASVSSKNFLDSLYSFQRGDYQRLMLINKWDITPIIQIAIIVTLIFIILILFSKSKYPHPVVHIIKAISPLLSVSLAVCLYYAYAVYIASNYPLVKLGLNLNRYAEISCLRNTYCAGQLIKLDNEFTELKDSRNYNNNFNDYPAQREKILESFYLFRDACKNQPDCVEKYGMESSSNEK